MSQKIAYLDCQAGSSANMVLAALCDAGLVPDSLQQKLSALPIQGYQLQCNISYNRGMRGSTLRMVQKESRVSISHLSDIAALLDNSTLSMHTRETTYAVFRRLAEAAAVMQGVSIEQAALQEVVSLETFILLVGVVAGLEESGITQLYASALPLTAGHRQTVHGSMPVPAPITLEILRQVSAPWKPAQLEGEPVTPEGAAFLATCAHFSMPAIAIERVGYGFSLEHPTHGLRLCLGQPVTETEYTAEADTDLVAVLASHIDNMSGELLGGLMDKLFAEGALDVSYTPLHMKKNRPATLVTIIGRLEDGERLAMVLLRETSTLGIRIQQVQRLKAQRSQQSIVTPLGAMLVKVKCLGTRIISAAPEYEECQRIAREQNMPLPEVYDIARQAIRSIMQIPHDLPHD